MIYLYGGGDFLVTHSNIQQDYTGGGEGNISIDPLFVDPNVGDYHLQGESRGIDAGDPNAPGLPSTDKDGYPRVINKIPDLGAYEYIGDIANHAPTLDPIGDKTIKEGELLTFTISGSDPDPVDSLIFSAINLPPGAGFDAESRVFTWQTGYDGAGTYRLTFRVTDNGEIHLSDSEEISIRVIDADGPRIIHCTPSGEGDVKPPLQFIDLQFNKEIDPDSFRVEDVSMTGPSGAIIVNSITPLNATSFRIAISLQRLAGEYWVVIGPKITDLSQNPMNQDQDKSNGEEIEDQYTTSFSILAGLKISSHSLSGEQIPPVNSLTFTFSQEINPATLTLDDIVISGPAGKIAVTSGPTLVEGTTYQIEFAEQSIAGIYHVYLGPQIENKFGLAMDQDGDGIIGEETEDRYDAWFKIIDVAGPKVISHSPSGKIKAPVTSVEVAFNEAIDPVSFTVEDISITGPSSGKIIPDSVTVLAGKENTFKVVFPSQESGGDYRLIIGPQVLDLAGNPMNQDQDGSNGEAYDDRYISSFYIDTFGPKVVANSMAGVQNVPVQTIDLTFSEAIDSSSFTKEAVVVAGPGGSIVVIEVKQVTDDSASVFRIKLTPSATDGTYQVTITPAMRDLVGNLLDQDQDGRQGEIDDDKYSFTFVQQLPDLEVSKISHPVEARASGLIDVTWTVTNNGLGKAGGQWKDTIYLSQDSTAGADDVKIGEVQCNQPVEPGQVYTRTIAVTMPDLINGQRWIIVKTNNSQGSLVEQGGGANNTKVAIPPLWVTTRPYPDLQVSGVELPDKANTGSKVTISWTVENKGNAATSSASWNDKLYLSLDAAIGAGDIELATICNADLLAQGESYNQIKEVSIPGSVAQGNYYLLVKTDVEDKVEEFDREDNNVGQSKHTIEVSVPPSSPAFLKVTSIIVPPLVEPGTRPALTWTVTNTGGKTIQYGGIGCGWCNKSCSGWDDGLALSKDTAYDKDDYWLSSHRLFCDPPLDPGESYTQKDKPPENAFPAWIPGTYYLIVIPDTHLFADTQSFESIGQSTIEREYGVIPIKLGYLKNPDLTPISLTVIPSTGISGQNINLSWSVKNIGDGPTRTTTWDDIIFLSEDQLLDEKDQKLGQITHQGALDPGKNYQVTGLSIKLPAGLEGSYYILIKTDIANSVWESNEENNIRVSDTQMAISLIESDLQIQPELTSGPANGVAGQLISVRWTVINAGAKTTAIGNWIDKVYLSKDEVFDPQDTLLGSATQSTALGSGQTYSNIQDFKLPEKIEGTYHLIIITDADNSLYEHNAEGNNSLCITPAIKISDLSADLRVESFTIASQTGIAGQTIQVNWEISNKGTAVAKAPWKDAVYLSADLNFDSSDKLLTSPFVHSEPLAIDASYGSSTAKEIRLPDATVEHPEQR